MRVFWEQGYAGTSLDELSAATGMARPSLYAAFGDKRSLFERAVERFRQRMASEAGGALQHPELVTALTRFYSAALGIYAEPDGTARGCLVFSVAPVEAAHDDALRTHVARAVRELDAALSARFQRAIDEGELPAERDAGALGSMAAALLHSLSVRARTGTSRRGMLKFVRQGVQQLVR